LFTAFLVFQTRSPAVHNVTVTWQWQSKNVTCNILPSVFGYTVTQSRELLSLCICLGCLGVGLGTLGWCIYTKPKYVSVSPIKLNSQLHWNVPLLTPHPLHPHTLLSLS
jgi:hypothetical protein